MDFNSFSTKQYLIAILAVFIFAALVIPYPSVSVPEWRIVLIDKNFLPGAQQPVIQEVGNAYYGYSGEYEAITDKNGFAVFPARYVWKGLGSRMIAGAVGVLGWDNLTRVTIRGKENCPDGSVVWEEGQKELPKRISCPGPERASDADNDDES